MATLRDISDQARKTFQGIVALAGSLPRRRKARPRPAVGDEENHARPAFSRIHTAFTPFDVAGDSGQSPRTVSRSPSTVPMSVHERWRIPVVIH